MYEFHARLGEGLFAIYLVVMIAVYVIGRRGNTVPSAVIGVAHGLLALQVALGVILFAEAPGRVVWYHPLLGILAILALGLTPVLRRRLGQQLGIVATLGVVAALALAARLAVG